jgi:hypothetical protein
MNHQFPKNHLLDFEIIAALCIGALLKYKLARCDFVLACPHSP